MKNFFKVQRKFKGGFKVRTLKVKSISIMIVFTLLMTVFMPITASARTVAPATHDGERDMAISSDGVITWERLGIDDTCEEIYGNPVIYKLEIVSGDGAHVLEEIPNLTSTSYNLIEHMDAQRYYTNRFSFRVSTNYSTPGGGIPVYYYVSPYQKLDAPTNLRWDGNTARWNAAQNAVNYHISLYNTIGELVEGHNTNNLYYTPSSTPLDGWYFEVYSKATGDYFDSNENESPKKGANNVTFDLNGGTWTDAGTNSQVVYDGETATRPTNPTKSGHVFAGWYADSACTTPFSFLTAITSNKTIYAKWDIITNSVNAILSPTPSVGLTIGDLVLTSGDSSKYSVSAGYWKLNDSGSALDKSSTQFEAGQTYTLYLTYYPENEYVISEDATYTVNGIPTEWSGFEAESNRKISFTIPAVTTYTVSGSVTSFNDASGDITLQLIPEGLSEPAYETTVKGNTVAYSFADVVAGTYTMKVSKANHVTREYTVVVGTDDVTQDVKIHLKGDINGDGRISVSDVGLANAHAKKVSTLEGYQFDCANVNGDTRITISDVGLLNAHAKKTSLLW